MQPTRCRAWLMSDVRRRYAHPVNENQANTRAKDRRMLLSEPQSFEFYTDQSGRHFLNVFCGGIDLFIVRIALTDEEVSRYREWGDHFIQKLVLDIQHSPDSFAARAIHP
jgi:hypothetical protein